MLKSFLHYSKSQQIGIILLFLIILVAQSIYFFKDFNSVYKVDKGQAAWLANQRIIDSVQLQQANYKPTIYPFNPNFITDFKGYKLGMSVEEIDRLLAFRKQNKFVNSASEFQAVTKVSDSLLKAISPYFKFPDWVKNKKNNYQPFENKNYSKAEKVIVLDINEATKEDLMKVYGIGDKISDRILTEKEKYGGFVSMEQMQFVWGLSPEVIENLNKYFEVKSAPKIKRININNASVKELSQFPFFKYALAKDIVIYRSMNGDIKTEDLSKIKGFPIDKIKIIALYLEF
ncbi:helix-hairpin-helix domain-containing protein [Flavobacterium sp.]|jgi:DNA uptake protein ComE-like DNA-binding protein|uniref:helix-hairpin-helix domain-containing protein n=1 Tax=Flavobacterium sp. TaxID=239 RepID=UPI00391B2BFD